MIDTERLAQALKVTVAYGEPHPDQYRRTVAAKIVAAYFGGEPPQALDEGRWHEFVNLVYRLIPDGDVRGSIIGAAARLPK